MNYRYITIQAIPAPLDAVLDDGSEYTRGVARETALAESAPALAERVAHLEWLIESIPTIAAANAAAVRVVASSIRKADEEAA